MYAYDDAVVSSTQNIFKTFSTASQAFSGDATKTVLLYEDEAHEPGDLMLCCVSLSLALICSSFCLVVFGTCYMAKTLAALILRSPAWDRSSRSSILCLKPF
ncbi:hypothetical protein BDA96_07G215100 [Sorghum bicolor]|uniref:Uncharacterized protein n=2 Tax=Sorghum bicolor TaxID=4558 RepID=A0A1Z5RAS5_SORBI|nr:hypothetical protein BDA96_07G215100 [Sorghum bicolor]OQU80874.1 hypothetical protein SORBI_3007G202360 [Sorghum bicolor]